MSSHATSTFEIKGWDAKPYDEFDDGRKLTRATVTKSYLGDIEGEGKLEYLMVYGPDGSASFVGVERVVGRIGGRSGSFVLQHNGTFQGGVARDTWLVVPDSGTGNLQGLRGKCDFSSGHAKQYAISLDYDFE